MKSQKQSGFTTLEMLLVLVMVGIIGYVGYYVYHSQNNANSAYDKAASLKTTVKTTPKKTTASTTAAPVISAALKENTAAAINSGNTAALEGYMASSVNVVIAASEKTGAESTALAIKDLDYLNSGTKPWNFSVAAATLTAWQKGFYAQYFETDTTIVGESANSHVVSFGVNTSGKIDVVFMAASADLLE